MPRLLIACLLLFVSQACAQAFVDGQGPDITEYELANGVKLVVIPDRRAPVVTHMVWYRVGSADDPKGKSGVAHFLEHLMFKGTKNHLEGEFSAAVAEIGGQENAFTSYDYTAYFQKVSPNALADMMRYEADRMQNLVLSDDVFYPERKVILEERSSRIDSNPGSILAEFARAAFHVHHPYGIPIIGWEHEIEEIEQSDILDFYKKWYQPWNVIVVVAGDVQAEAVLKIANETYGSLTANSPEIIRIRLKNPETVVSKEVNYSDARVTTPSWSRSFPTPSYYIGQNREAEALDLLAAILGESVTSRLYKDMVIDNPIALSAGAYYQGSQRDNGSFGLYASPRGDASLAQLEARMEALIDEVLSKGITQKELDTARDKILRRVIFSQDSQVTLARIFGATLAIDGSIEDVTLWPDRLREVTVDDINAVARKYLIRNKAVTSRLLPEATR